MQELSEIQVRVLGCLIEKESTTPDQYPLTLNALRNACNQKSARAPVVNYTEGEVAHAVRELEGLGLVREAWGARVVKYEHRADKILGLYNRGMALLSTLMLRGPQTLGELKSHSQRLFDFDDLDDVNFAVQKLVESEPPLVTSLPPAPGQKGMRFAHLLCGEPQQLSAPVAPKPVGGLEARLVALEERMEELERQLAQLQQKQLADDKWGDLK
jgi:hypothetical protein